MPRDVKQIYGADGGEQRPNVISNLSGEPMTLATARVTNPPAEPMPKPETPPPAPGKEPGLLVVPFGEDEARTARKAWALYHQIDEERKNSIGMKLTLIPAGEFQMGSTPAEIDKVPRFDSSFKKEYADDEQPQHRVRITRPFYLGTCEVTKGQFRKFVDDTGYKTDAEKDGKGGYGYDGKSSFEQRPSSRGATGESTRATSTRREREPQRRRRLLRLAEPEGREAIPTADGGGVGIRLPGGDDKPVLQRRRSRERDEDWQRG